MRSPRGAAFIAGAFALLAVACGPGHTQSFVSGAETGTPGAWARAFLTDTVFTRLDVTVDFVPGEEPSEVALAFLERRLVERCRKPGGISVHLGRPIAARSDGVYGVADIASLAAVNRTVFASGDTASIYVLALDGRSSGENEDGVTLGLTTQATCFAIFEDPIRADARASGFALENLEGAVLLHEAGHLLGLVNLLSPMVTPHEDPTHAHHCTNGACVMSWLLWGRDAGREGGLDAIDFDAACVADLRANGGL